MNYIYIYIYIRRAPCAIWNHWKVHRDNVLSCGTAPLTGTGKTFGMIFERKTKVHYIPTNEKRIPLIPSLKPVLCLFNCLSFNQKF